jgi:hypothetical protein
VVKDGKPFVIPSREGYSTIPGGRAQRRGKLSVASGRGQLLISPGTPSTERAADRPPVPVTGGHRSAGQVQLRDRLRSSGEAGEDGRQVFAAEDLSLVLAEVKELAQRWLGCRSRAP